MSSKQETKNLKRVRRLAKKRQNNQRAVKLELDRVLEIQRNILAILIMKNQLTFSPQDYGHLLQEIIGEDMQEIEYDTPMYWSVVLQLKKMHAWVKNLDPKGQQWRFNPTYVSRVRRQVAAGELPMVSLWMDSQEDSEPAVKHTGKRLGGSEE